MEMWRRAALATVFLLAACTTGADGPSAPSSTRPAAPDVSTTGSPQPTRVTRELPVAAERPTADWMLMAELSYGSAIHELGTADTHGGQTSAWGPEYAAPDRDGSWWVLDIQKHRVARFDHGGEFLGAVPIPGEFAEFQLPFVVGDQLWASGGRGESLLVDESSARRLPVSGAWPYCDGTRVYDTTGMRSLDPSGSLVPDQVEALLTPSGTPFRVHLAGDDRTDIEVTLPDSGRQIVISLIGPSGAPPETVGYEVQADVADRLHFFVIGVTGDAQLAGFFTLEISAGSVSAMEPTQDPFSEADASSPAHLRVIPGTTSAAVSFLDGDALRIYRRDWPERPLASP